MKDESKTEIILGNKNVAEAGSTQVNITQNNFDPSKLAEVLKGLGGKAKSSPKKSDVSPKPKIVETTFRYRWWESDASRVGLLYQALLRATVNGKKVGWIDHQTRPEDFGKLFSGESTTLQVKWTGTKQHLKYLFKVLLERGYICIPGGGRQPWVIVQSHFVDPQRNIYTDWDSEKDPIDYKNAIEAMAELLNADLTIEEVMRIAYGR